MYHEVLSRKQEEWVSKDFVGTLSYKASLKIDVAKIDRMIRFEKVSETPLFKLDAVFFFCAKNSVHACNRIHTNFSKIWNDVLVQQCQVTSTQTAYCNFWMAKPSLMVSYIR
jgi:hypothetical protein